jgi:hypothetical protein
VIPGGFVAGDSSTSAGSSSPAVNILQRCDRPEDHRPHGPYVRPPINVDYSCPGGPIDPTLFAIQDHPTEVAS